jgi:hypothetical protein
MAAARHSRTARDRRPGLVVAVVGLTVLAGCASRSGPAVQLGFRAPARSTLAYDVTVATSVTTQLGAPKEHHTNRTHFVTRQSVLDGADRRVAIEVGSPGAARHYVARLSRNGGLAALESADGLPASVDGDLGPAEVFPGATDAIPTRKLRPGDHWRIDERLTLAGYRGRLQGRGRLVGLRSRAATARVATVTTLPVRREIASEAGELELIGSQATTTDADYDVKTGSVVRARATTVGRYVVVIPPPPGTSGKSVQGKLTVRVTSTSIRASTH